MNDCSWVNNYVFTQKGKDNFSATFSHLRQRERDIRTAFDSSQCIIKRIFYCEVSIFDKFHCTPFFLGLTTQGYFWLAPDSVLCVISDG